MSTPLPTPKRGGIHPVYGLYIGCASLNQGYEGTGKFSYASQRRNEKGLAFIEQNLMNARDSPTSLKFDGNLEVVGSSVTEMGKERFLTLLQRRVEEHGQQTFYFFKDPHDTVVNLFDEVHNFTLDMVVTEFHFRNDFSIDHSAFDSYERDEIMLSRLVVESYLSTSFFEKILVRYGHRQDFKTLSGACLLVMALETCNASASLDVDEATAALAALTLDNYPGENVSDMMNEALRLIKIMKTAFMIPNNTGSRLLQKLTKTSSEEFNRKIFHLLDQVKNMEYKYKMLTPTKLLQDAEYPKYGPIGLISTLHEIYGRLIADRDWPAVASRFPQSNSAPAPIARRLPPSSEASRLPHRPPIKCFRCGGPHHIRQCPVPPSNNNNNNGYHNNNNNARTKSSAHPAWRYVEPKDLTKPVIDEMRNVWKFCTKCVCNKTGRTGLYLKSHYDHEHNSSHETLTHESRKSSNLPSDYPKNSVNLAVSRGTSTRGAITKYASDDDPLEFQGAWCASVLTEMEFDPPHPQDNDAFTPSDSAYDIPHSTMADCYVSPTGSFMGFCPEQDLHPIIFDTGASLAINHNKPDFDGLLLLPKGDLCLGGMANDLEKFPSTPDSDLSSLHMPVDATDLSSESLPSCDSSSSFNTPPPPSSSPTMDSTPRRSTRATKGVFSSTRTKERILNPGTEKQVDCHVDADSGGLFSVEGKQDPVSVKSHTGYVTTYHGAPLMWVSKIQTQVALDTMEAKYIAFREVLEEIMTIVFKVEPGITYHSHSQAFTDTVGTTAHVIPQSTVFEDNEACLKFARMPKLTPRTKHIGIPYHWFRTQVERMEIHIESISTTDQLADQFTKGLPVEVFRVARKKLMGW